MKLTSRISAVAVLPAIALQLFAQTRPAGSDPNYRALRDAAPAETLRVDNIELKRDVGTLTLRSGQITFLTPVMNRVTMAVFNGEGRFLMKPAIPIEAQHLNKATGKPEIDETFDSALLSFTDATAEEIHGQARASILDARAAEIVKDYRRKLRNESFSNIDVDVLSELYNPAQGPSFRAFLHGKIDTDLRFFMVPGGAIPAILSPEEVALVSLEPEDRAGILYLSHLESEWKAQTVSSTEDHHAAGAQDYRVETTINGADLKGVAEITVMGKRDGTRVIGFDLLPSLRVTRVTDQGGREMPFVQEPLKDDAAFSVILPEPIMRGKTYQIHIEYSGNKVIHSEGQGNFSVGARESWYPSLNSFFDRATYDLTFKVPKQFTLVSVGKLVKEWKEDAYACSQWKSDIPLAVAGFNYGSFRKKAVTDGDAKYDIEAYATAEAPDYLRELKDVVTITPSAMADRALVDAQNSMRLFQRWFGSAPYGRIAITQQPQFNFGQSWPSLVYLPVSAFLDSTQRWRLMEGASFRFNDFIQEVTPHEVSHQWWGHMVGFASYHDQWLSEGFADFSAGLFLEATAKPGAMDNFWDRLRDAIVQKNNFGNSANDAGPLWLGQRLNTFKNRGAYNRLVYSKGGYFLQMVRMLMQDDQTGDKDFIAMMHDFVQTYLHKNPSGEDFRSMVEKHMKPALDAEGNHRADWLFADWIYGTDLPKYRIEYSILPGQGGQVTFDAKLTQSEVSPEFLMRVPLYFDFDGRWVRGGRVTVKGNMTANIKVNLPKAPKRISINAHHDILAAETAVKKLQ